MKRLSTNINQTERCFSRLSFNPKSIIYEDNGSYLETESGEKLKGTCIGCENKTCLEYSAEELSTPVFQAFPHNTSKRVCPTMALVIDPSTGRAIINPNDCIACGLCVRRCPTAAIQISIQAGSCSINHNSIIEQICSKDEQKEYIKQILTRPRSYSYSNIPEDFSDNYQKAISKMSKRIADISEIIVRNTLINLGIPCNTNAAGNNHNRTEFFGQQDQLIIIGESNSSDGDTLSITRRILDDEAVMVSRYGIDKERIRPLSVMNGLPHKRADYYEVVHDIRAILGIQVSTITYHILFILNLFGIRLGIQDLAAFVIDNKNQDLLPVMKELIPDIETIDQNCHGNGYLPTK